MVWISISIIKYLIVADYGLDFDSAVQPKGSLQKVNAKIIWNFPCFIFSLEGRGASPNPFNLKNEFFLSIIGLLRGKN